MATIILSVHGPSGQVAVTILMQIKKGRITFKIMVYFTQTKSTAQEMGNG